MVYMHILSKRFADAGLRDLLIQSLVISEGSSDKALCGKMYNRGVRMYKLMYEAITRKVFDYMESMEGVDGFKGLEDFTVDLSNGTANMEYDALWECDELQKHYNSFLDAKGKLEDGTPLQQLWMSFLEMTEVLLNTIFSIRSGHWELLLECIRRIIPYAFAYDNINYARYLTYMLGDMLQLPMDFPEIYEQFMEGNFAAQICDNHQFSRIETDKVIEVTLNKDTKTPGGCTGFSTNVNAVKKWEINAPYRAALRKCFHKHINYQSQNFKHPDLSPSRIKKDEDDVQRILSTISTTFVDPLSPLPLLSISTGIMATEKVTIDMMTAKQCGQTAMSEFTETRLSQQATKSFFDPMKKIKLSTFSTMAKVKECKVNSKIIPLQATRELFAKIALIAQIRSLNMRLVFQYPLGPLPWSLAEPIGTLKKTSKANLLHTRGKHRIS